MPIAAHFEELTADAKRPRAPRRRLLLSAAAATPSGQTSSVLIHNVSASGLLIETRAALLESDRFDIVLPELGPTATFVVWNSGNLFGCRFAVPLGAAVLSSLQLRADAAPPREPTPLSPSQTETLPVRLARLRKQQGLTLESLAELVGVSKPTVWAWEQGKSRPTPDRLAKLAARLGVVEEDLLTGRNHDALAQALANAREQVAGAFGVDPARVKVMIEL
jgi:DNA-binding transcriptional regulator YiaG